MSFAVQSADDFVTGKQSGAKTNEKNLVANNSEQDLAPFIKEITAIDAQQSEVLARAMQFEESLEGQRPAGISEPQWFAFRECVLDHFGDQMPVSLKPIKGGVSVSGIAAGDTTALRFHGLPVEMEWRATNPTAPLFVLRDRPQNNSADWISDGQSRFAVIESAEFVGGDFIEPEWQIDERVPKRGIGLEWGASGTFKSFAIYDLAAAIHRGVPWRDRAVTKGRAVIVVAEGEHFYSLRVRGYAQHHGAAVDELPAIIPAPVNLFAPAQVKELIAELKKRGATFVVLDTLSQCATGADENSAKDMNVVIASMKRISREVGCFVCAVHHSGKNEDRGARGSSVLKPAVDVEVHHEAIGTQGYSTIEKLKDGPPGARFAIQMKEITLGVSKKTGKPFGSLVVEHVEGGSTVQYSKKRKEPTGNQLIVLQAMRKHFPTGAPYLEELFDVCRAELRSAVQKPARVKEYFRTAVQKLADTQVNKWLYRHPDDRISLHSVVSLDEAFD